MKSAAGFVLIQILSESLRHDTIRHIHTHIRTCFDRGFYRCRVPFEPGRDWSRPRKVQTARIRNRNPKPRNRLLELL